MNLLIHHRLAEYFKNTLQSKFPGLTIRAAAEEGQIGDFIQVADIVLALRLPDALVRQAGRLKWIQATTSGVDYWTALPSLPKDVVITSTRGVHGPQVSELALLHMLALARRLPQMLHNQDRKVWDRWMGGVLNGKHVGIVGLGAIGEEIAKKCRAFDMTVHGLDAVPKDLPSIDYFYRPDGLLEMAAKVDFLVVIVPYTPHTGKMISGEVLSRMKPTAFLVSISRGEVVDEEALLDVLKKGKIAGAGIDAFTQEPLPADSPFWTMENVIVTPHIGGVSELDGAQILSIFEENLRRFLAGERKNLVNLVER